uniref:Nuclear transcription factor Y subunit n=1 Tax=Rhabditophanes sp. KR3021 TaxID=114890 RepID=A0AC35UI70_9BILA
MTPEQMLSSGLQFVQTDSLNSDGTPQIIPMQLTTLPDGQTVMMPAQFHVLSRGNEIDNTNKIVSHLNNSNAPVVQMISNSGCSSAQSSEQVNTETNSDISEANDGQTVYVNQLQFKRIMARREARLKLLMGGKLPKQRQKYLHESRHKHAQKRVRGVAGAFA